MTEVGFYHLTTKSLDWAVARLLERALLRGLRRPRHRPGGEGARALDRLQGRRPRGHLLAADRGGRLGEGRLALAPQRSPFRCHAKKRRVSVSASFVAAGSYLWELP